MSPKARHKARVFALQAVYQWQYASHTVSEIVEQYQGVKGFNKIDKDYFLKLLNGVVDKVEQLDAQIKPFLDRNITELNQIELAVLRLSTYELIFFEDVPYKVIINEALELTKTYGSIEGYKYINGVIDKIAHKVR